MFDALLKPKNNTKCKNCLKLIKTRLETIRKKKNAVQKFLKNDIVDLLRNSLDYNAYGRAEGFLVEQNMSACYELIAKFVAVISVHVRDLFKQSDCPDECKEAIPSLIYAAARFSDLPELRELRTLFTEKFGNTLEPYTCKEFIERLKQNPPSKETKIQLLHELAQEFSIEWDRKALEQRLYAPLLHQEKEKLKHDDQLLPEKEKPKPKHDDQFLQEKEKPKHDDQQKDSGEAILQKNVTDNNVNHDDPWWRMLRSSTENETTLTDTSSLCSSSIGNASGNVSEDDEAEIKTPFSYKSLPPPYIKVDKNLKKTPEALLSPEKPVPRSVRRRPLRPPPDENTVKDFSKTGGSFDEKEILDGLLMESLKKESPNNKEKKKRYTKSSSSVPTTMRGTPLPQRGPQRATSLVPELLRTTTDVRGPVHPSLPEYEDLSARLASLRRT